MGRGDSSSLGVPVVAGLATGIAFVILFALFMTPMLAITRGRPTIQEEFQRVEQLQEVQSFMQKYPDFTSGFAKSETAVTYYYNVSRWGDSNGDGSDDSFRRLALFVTFEDGLAITKDAISRLHTIQIECDAASVQNRTLHNLIPPVFGEKDVMDFCRMKSVCSLMS
jgi:hypothetical protein